MSHVAISFRLKPCHQDNFLCDIFHLTIFDCSCRRMKLTNFYMAILFAEKNVRFYIANKNCYIQIIVRVDKRTHKWLQSF